MDLPAGNALPASASRAPAAALRHVPGALLQTTSDGRNAFSGGTLAGMKRDELVAWLDQYLDIGAYRADPSMNGLQVQGSDEVTKVAVAVDASLNTFQQATSAGADMLIVHHGLFWGQPLAITGMHRERVKYLLDSQLSLYAAHIPLDAHREVGNNWGLAPILGLKELEPFGEFRGQPIGVKGVFPEAVPIRQLASDIEKQLGEQVMVHAGGPPMVRNLGIISGGAAWDVVTAADQGLDAFLTGEPKHEVFHHPYEMGINAIYAEIGRAHV